jgi:hypothetical protein
MVAARAVVNIAPNGRCGDPAGALTAEACRPCRDRKPVLAALAETLAPGSAQEFAMPNPSVPASPRHASRAALALIAGLAIALVGGTASAQLSVAVGASGKIDGVLLMPADCGQAFAVGTPVSCQRSGADGAQIDAAAQALPAGTLTGAAFASHDGAADWTIASASASWTERVSFSTLTRPVTVRHWLDITGTQGTTARSGDGSETVASTATFIRMNVYREGNYADPTQFDELLVARYLADRGAGSVSAYTGIQRTRRGTTLPIDTLPGYPASPSFVFRLDAGTSFYDFTWNFASNAQVSPGHSGEAWTLYQRPAHRCPTAGSAARSSVCSFSTTTATTSRPR